MKFSVHFLCVLFCMSLIVSCKSSLQLYTDAEGCVFSDDTRNIKLNGEIDTSYLLSKKDIYWDLIYIVKDGVFRDQVIMVDTLQSFLLIDSNRLLYRYNYYYGVPPDTIHLANVTINKKFLIETINQYKDFIFISNLGEFQFRLLYLQYPIAITYSKRRKVYYIFRAIDGLKVVKGK